MMDVCVDVCVCVCVRVFAHAHGLHFSARGFVVGHGQERMAVRAKYMTLVRLHTSTACA